MPLKRPQHRVAELATLGSFPFAYGVAATDLAQGRLTRRKTVHQDEMLVRRYGVHALLAEPSATVAEGKEDHDD